MKRFILNTCLFFLMSPMGTHNLNAQKMNIEHELPKEYEFRIKKDTADADMILASYEAVNRESGTAPFEIMVSDMDVSLMPKTMEEWIGSILEVIKNHSPAAKLETMKEEENRKLYLIKSGDDTGILLILMKKTAARFVMIEAEIPQNELLVVSMDRWAEAFWNAATD